MRVVPASTARSLATAGGNAVKKTEAPSAERIARAGERQRALNVVTGNGCGYCCGKLSMGPRGTTLECAVLIDEACTPEQAKAANGCPIPKLYAQVWNFERLDVTPEEVMELVPYLPQADAAATDTGTSAEVVNEPPPVIGQEAVHLKQGTGTSDEGEAVADPG